MNTAQKISVLETIKRNAVSTHLTPRETNLFLSDAANKLGLHIWITEKGFEVARNNRTGKSLAIFAFLSSPNQAKRARQ